MKRLVMAVGFCLWASSAFADGPLYKFSLATAIAAHGADVASQGCLWAHRCREANPILAPFAHRPLVMGAIQVGGAAFQLWVISKVPNKRVATVAHFVVTGVFTGIAIRNARLH